MKLLLETIAVEAGGRIPLLEYHHRRYMDSCINEHQSAMPELDSSDKMLERILKAEAEQEYKSVDLELSCRILYYENGDIQRVEIHPRNHRHIQRAAAIELPQLEYGRKYADRQIFTDLHLKHPGYDEIIILKEGRLTDGSFTNLYLRKPHSPLLTPASPLLPGCRRAMLLEAGELVSAELRLDEFEPEWKIGFINALNPPGKLGEVEISRIQILS